MSITGDVQRGSIVLLRFSPQSGHEQNGNRPGIIISDGFIDPDNNHFAIVAPITNRSRGNVFHVPVPKGVMIEGQQSELTGFVLTEQVKSLDLNSRDAKVIGQVDVKSEFYQTIVTYVRSMLA